MIFADLQTAYDRQLPDEPESTPLHYRDVSNDNVWYVAERLAERLADVNSLSWGYRRSFITCEKVQESLSEDCATMYEYIRLGIYADANDAQKYMLAQWDLKAKDMIYEMIGEEEALPVGYSWEDFI